MSVTTTYRWDKYNVSTTYPLVTGSFGAWSSYYTGESYSGYTAHGFNASTGTFSPSGWQTGGLGEYYNNFYSGTGSSTTETEVEFILDGVSKYRERTRTLSAGTPSYSQGSTKIETVSSTSRSAYPDNDYSSGYWYVYAGSVTTTDSSYSYIKTNCSNGSNGTITGSATGGSGTHYFKLMKGTATISNWSTTYSFTGLSGGTYVLYGKDAQATNTEYTATISVVSAASFTASKTNCSAYGTSDGAVYGYGSNGTGSYEYKLLLGAAVISDWSSASSYTSLSAGSYTLKCRDAAYTAYETTLSLSVLSPAYFSYVKTNNTNSATPNGTITASGVGGSGTYLFSLDGGTAQSSGEFTGLSADTYLLLCAEQGGTATQTEYSVVIALDDESNHCVGATRYKLYIGNTEYGEYVGGSRII